MLLFLIPSFASLGSADYYSVGRGTIFASNLEFDINLEAYPEIFGFMQSKKQQKAPVNLAPIELENGDMQYCSNMYFVVDYWIWTAYSANEVFPSPTTTTVSTTWCDMYTSIDPLLFKANYNQYAITYDTYSSLGTNKAKGIDAYLQIDANFDDVSTSDLQKGDSGYTTNSYDYDIVEITLQDISYADIGVYSTTYGEDAKNSKVTSEISNKDMSDKGAPASVSAYVSKLGVSTGAIYNDEFQQGEKSIGSVSSQNKFHLELVPNVNIQKQKVTTSYRSVAIDTETGLFGASPAGVYTGLCVEWGSGVNNHVWYQSTQKTEPGSTSSSVRTVGWDVQNYVAKLQFVVEIYVTSDVEINYDDSSDYTADVDPYELEDRTLSLDYEGETGGDVITDSDDPVQKLIDGVLDQVLADTTNSILIGMGIFGILVYLLFFRKKKATTSNPS